MAGMDKGDIWLPQKIDPMKIDPMESVTFNRRGPINTWR